MHPPPAILRCRANHGRVPVLAESMTCRGLHLLSSLIDCVQKSVSGQACLSPPRIESSWGLGGAANRGQLLPVGWAMQSAFREAGAATHCSPSAAPLPRISGIPTGQSVRPSHTTRGGGGGGRPGGPPPPAPRPGPPPAGPPPGPGPLTTQALSRGPDGTCRFWNVRPCSSSGGSFADVCAKLPHHHLPQPAQLQPTTYSGRCRDTGTG